MQKLSNEFCHLAIKNAFPDATEIKLPPIPGKVAQVYTFQTDDGPQVCRFNEKPIIARNHKLTRILYDYGAPLKPTKPHVYLGQYFESYEYNPHQTLCETMPNMSKKEIIDTYKSALCIQAYLASLPIQEFAHINNSSFMDVYNITMPHCITNNVMQYLYRTLYKHFSVGKNMCIMHSDLTPSNMLVTNDHHSVAGIIDFDAISICDENMAIFGMLRCYPLANTYEFIEYYQDVSGHDLNRKEIIRMLNLFKKTLNIRNYANKFTFSNLFDRH